MKNAQAAKLFRRIRIALIRLPKNLRINRYWIRWGGKLYVRRDMAAKAISSSPSTTFPAEYVTSGAQLYVEWRHLLLPHDAFPAHSRAILVTELGRFGNMVRRLAEGVAVASKWDAGGLLIPGQVVFESTIFSPARHLLANTQLWFATEPPRYNNPYTLIAAVDPTRVKGGQPASSVAHTRRIWRDLEGCLQFAAPPETRPPGHLAIHIRGGDVFGSRKPANYGQPPLAFYRFVAELRPWSHITLVVEDFQNPVVEPFKAWCEEVGIELTIQSSRLIDDLRVLMSFRHLVVARGTFGPAVACLSAHLDEVFYFEDKFPLVQDPQSFVVQRVVDLKGDYRNLVLQGNWAGTPEQLDMMLTYPEAHLALESANTT